MASHLNGFSALVGFIATISTGYAVFYLGAQKILLAVFALCFLLTAWNFYIWGMWQQDLSLREASKRSKGK